MKKRRRKRSVTLTKALGDLQRMRKKLREHDRLLESTLKALKGTG